MQIWLWRARDPFDQDSFDVVFTGYSGQLPRALGHSCTEAHLGGRFGRSDGIHVPLLLTASSRHRRANISTLGFNKDIVPAR